MILALVEVVRSINIVVVESRDRMDSIHLEEEKLKKYRKEVKELGVSL